MSCSQFSEVWLWQEWPGRDGKHHAGIDIAAADRLTGANMAIQHKVLTTIWHMAATTRPDRRVLASNLGHEYPQRRYESPPLSASGRLPSMRQGRHD